MNNLSYSIENFYRAFADVPAPAIIDGCPHCVDDKNTDVLLSTPLRELSADDLGSYAASAFLTVGDVADYLYFLPRIMEITIRDDSWWPDIEVTARAIRNSGFDSWPDFRKTALQTLLRDLLDYILETKDYWRIDGLMCAVGRLGIEVPPFLAMIEKDPDAVLEYWKDNAGKLHQGKLGNGFWELPNRQHDRIVEWFKSEPVRLLCSTAYGYKTN